MFLINTFFIDSEGNFTLSGPLNKLYIFKNKRLKTFNKFNPFMAIDWGKSQMD